jgi:integrase
LKESTVAHYLNHFRGLFKDLVSRNRLRESPLAGMTLHRAESNERDVFLTAPQVASLRAAARAHWKKENARTSGPRSPRWRETPSLELVLLLGAECGMRHGEFDAARPDWLDLEGGILNIPPEDHFEPGRPWKRKGRRGNRRPAVVPIPQVVKDWFAEFGTGGDYLLAPWKSWGKGKYRFEIAASWRRFMIREGFPGVTLHDLRRSFGSNRVSAGTSIEKVANWLGIDPKTALARYARFIPADREIEKGSSGEAPLSAAPPALADRLDKLRELRDGGIISEKEEAARRLEILREV